MHKTTTAISIFIITVTLWACSSNSGKQDYSTRIMKENQLTFLPKNHDLDNNDNFSPDDRFLCYDTRGTVYNSDLANCKSIEKVEIATSEETVLWSPEYVTGEKAAPGVAAVSWHPKKDKVIFIHGPLLEEVEERGYYGIRNRTGVEVSADGEGTITKVDMRDVATDRLTIPGAQRGGTHRHEYTRSGNRIGFTYDDYILQDYGRTIGYMEPSPKAPEGYTHYFTVLLNPKKKEEAVKGEVVKAYGDSWVDDKGSMRAFIGDVATGTEGEYDKALFIADIPEGTDITSGYPGDAYTPPTPPMGIRIRRLTHSGEVDGIVRGSYSGDKIAYLSTDDKGVKQVTMIYAFGSDLSEDPAERPWVLTAFSEDASRVRWHPTDQWIFSLVGGNVVATHVDSEKSYFLTKDDKERDELVVSHSGDMLAYTMMVWDEDKGKEFRQIFVMEVDRTQLK